MTYPDPLDAATLTAAVTAGDRLWRTVEVVPATGSTNADLAVRARRGEPAGTVLVTDHQQAGRGRLGRTWSAPAGRSIAVSVLLRPGQPFVRTEIIATVLAALALLYHRWEAGRDADLAAEYVTRSGTLGRDVTVLGGDGARTTGQAIGVDEAGRLRVRTPSGVQTFAAGDVTHLR